MIVRFFTFCFMAIFVSLLSSPAIGKPDAIVSSFWNEPQKKWDEYLQTMGGFECSMREKIEWSPTQKKDHSIDVVGNYPFALATIYDKEGTNIVRGYNDRYRFSIQQKKNGDGSWIINDIESLASSPMLADFSFQNERTSLRNFAGESIRDVLSAGLRLRIYWLPDLVQKPEFHVESCNYSEESGLRLATIQYTYDPKIPPQNFDIRSGTVVLMPDYYWLILRAEFRFADANPNIKDTGKITNTYTFISEHLPLLKRSEDKGYDKNDSCDFTVVREYDNVQKTVDTSHHRFTLSAYGLPEPDFEIRRTRFQMFRYVLLAVGAVLIGIALYRMYEQRRKETSRQ